MWLINTGSAELKFFSDPGHVPGGYAILSHVWRTDGQENTFQQVQELSKITLPNLATRFGRAVLLPPQRFASLSISPPLAATGDRTRESPGRTTSSMAQMRIGPFLFDRLLLLSPKVHNFLVVARRHGYNWAWVDTCCIDKTSSTELTEAINSMFRYYALSDVCFVYLHDVRPNSDLSDTTSDFHTSRWHTRGWTLQELIAPRTVVFMAADWSFLGTKFDLAGTLEEITGVPYGVLCFEVDVTDKSVAARLSWAARRKTNRPEDQAYCLFGLFGVNMPALYGEGHRAFYRLQEEIMKSSTDTSLFAWGEKASLASLEDLDTLTTLNHRDMYCEVFPYLSAKTLQSFIGSSELYSDGQFKVYDTPETSLRASSIARSGIPTFVFTPDGVRARLPLVKLGEDSEYVLADLFCSEYSEGAVRPVWMLLHLHHIPARGGQRLYHCCHIPLPASSPCRLFVLDDPRLAQQLKWRQTWEDIYLPLRPTYRVGTLYDDTPLQMVRRFERDRSSPFFIRPATLSDAERLMRCKLVFVTPTPQKWQGTPPLTLIFLNAIHDVLITVTLGRCSYTGLEMHPLKKGKTHQLLWSTSLHPMRPRASPAMSHYAFARFWPSNKPALNALQERPSFDGSAPVDLDLIPRHTCPEDHIAHWPKRTRTFRDASVEANVSLSLSFTDHVLGAVESNTLELHLNDLVALRSMY